MESFGFEATRYLNCSETTNKNQKFLLHVKRKIISIKYQNQSDSTARFIALRLVGAGHLCSHDLLQLNQYLSCDIKILGEYTW